MQQQQQKRGRVCGTCLWYWFLLSQRGRASHIAVHVEVLHGFRGEGTTSSHDAPKKATKWTGLPSTACDLAPPTLAALTRREEAVAVVTSNGLRGALVFIRGGHN